MSGIEALHVYDEHNNVILSHTFSSRAPPSSQLISSYLSAPSPRPSLLHLPNLNPPILLHSLQSDSVLFLSPTSADVPPLLVLEFLHRVSDALCEFLGSPLLGSRIEANYDIAAQVLSELCDGGLISGTEANALRDVVETPTSLSRFLGGVGLSAQQSSHSGPSSSMAGLGSNTLSSLQPQASIPWRRNNVRHTSNELYVDMIETISATFAPSGRALSAFANGSIAFTSKVSGVPDLLLTLTSTSLGNLPAHTRTERLKSLLQRPVFHPCVRLARWSSGAELSFVPPDGRFVLAGYEADLLADDGVLADPASLALPVSARVTTGLGPAGNEFEIRLDIAPKFAAAAIAAAAAQAAPRPTGARGFASAAAQSLAQSESRGPALEELKAFIPLPGMVARKVPDLRPSRGEAHFSPAEGGIVWTFSTKVLGSMRAATLKGIMNEGLGEEDDGEEKTGGSVMPRCVSLSFAVRGWLASGLRVDSLSVDTKRSRGLGEGVKPYKGVKYLTVSRGGVEVRC